MNIENIIKELRKEVKDVRINEPMSKHTSFKIGGPADIFVAPANRDELIHTLSVCKNNHVPYYIIGNGSNVLVKDKGFRGVIIQIYKNFNHIKIDGETVYVEAGILLSKLSKLIATEGLQGFEFASGIPGTLGGAIYMNAGAYGGEISQVLVSADVIDHAGNIITMSNDELKLGYRTSILQDNNYTVISAVLSLKKGNKEEIKALMKDLDTRRKTKQPLELPSAGSTFKRPEGYYAGKLIMDSDLRGYVIGDAMVSEKHCGFVVNKGNATASDVLNLINHIQKTVKEKYGVDLEREVRVIGE